MKLGYTKSHEWARKEGDLYICGLSAYAQEKVGDIVFVELPEVGTQVKQGESCGVIESVKAANDLYTPLSGEIAEANDDLEENPEKVNTSPLDEGWIFKIKASDEDFSELMNEEEYQAYLSEQEDE